MMIPGRNLMPHRQHGIAGVLFLWVLLLIAVPTTVSADVDASIEASIVGLELKGQKGFERLVLLDFDVVLKDDSSRFVPLRRLLNELRVPFEEIGDTLFFHSPAGHRITMLPLSNELAVDTVWTESPMMYGVSDVTGNVEIFIKEQLLKPILGIDLRWDESVFGYFGSTEETFPIWKQEDRARNKVVKRRRDRDLTSDIPDLLPPSGPSMFGDPALHFLQPGIRFSQNSEDRTMLTKSLDAWGRLVGGRYAVKLRQPDEDLSSDVQISQASLTHRFGDIETTAGDVVFGLGGLVFPSVVMSGFGANGLLGLRSDERDNDRSNFGRREQFLSRRDFVGSAPMGSKVELLIDDRLVDEQIIEKQEQADPGDGIYRFEGVDLFQDRVSEVRIEITEPDGEVTQHIEEVTGTGSLLQPGQLLFGGGTGGHRFSVNETWKQQGLFGGGRIVYGVTPFLSFGGTAAYQDQFSLPYELDRSEGENPVLSDAIPTKSEHYGVESRLQIAGRHLLTVEGAVSKAQFQAERAGFDNSDLPSDEDFSSAWGSQMESASSVRTTLDLHLSRAIRLSPQVFRYEPAFFNGSNVQVKDREGYAVSSRLKIGRYFRADLSHGSVANNVNGDSTITRIQQWQHADIPLPRIVPSTQLQLKAFRFEHHTPEIASDSIAVGRMKVRTLAELSVNSTLLRFVKLNGRVTAGKRLTDRQDVNLLSGLVLPNTPTSQRTGWRIEASRELFKNGQLQIGHWNSEYRERTLISHRLRATEQNHWQNQIEIGYDWNLNDWYGHLEPGYYFDRSGTSKITGTARYQSGDWLFAVTVTLRPAISFAGRRPILTPASRISPSRGGIQGMVFYDENGNGKKDSNEAGVPDIQLVTNEGRRTVTDKRGNFLISAVQQKRRMRVAINPQDLSAIYTPTNGAQWARLEPGLLTPVYLGITELGSISGFVLANQGDSSETKAVGGVVVIARNQQGRVAQESVTYSDGSYYLGDLMPGEYSIEIKTGSLPKRYQKRLYKESVTITGDRLDIMGMNLMIEPE